MRSRQLATYSGTGARCVHTLITNTSWAVSGINGALQELTVKIKCTQCAVQLCLRLSITAALLTTLFCSPFAPFWSLLCGGVAQSQPVWQVGGTSCCLTLRCSGQGQCGAMCKLSYAFTALQVTVKEIRCFIAIVGFVVVFLFFIFFYFPHYYC